MVGQDARRTAAGAPAAAAKPCRRYSEPPPHGRSHPAGLRVGANSHPLDAKGHRAPPHSLSDFFGENFAAAKCHSTVPAESHYTNTRY